MTKKSWRDVIPPHPAADLFPMMERDELIALGEDIRKNGLGLGPILWEAEKGAPRQLLDGRNRLDAMEAVGLPVLDTSGNWLVDSLDWKCSTIRFDDPYAIALSMNIHRRHLTADQKHDLIANVLKATPGKSNRQIAEQVKADDKTVGKVRRELEVTAEIPQLETTIGKDGKARKQPVKKKRRDVDDYLAGKRAKKITETAAVSPTAHSTASACSFPAPDQVDQARIADSMKSTERQFAVLTDLWRMNNTLRTAWEGSNLKAQRRFIQWLDGDAREIDEPPKGRPRRAGDRQVPATYKPKPIKTTVAGAIGDAFSAIEELAGEMRETHDNMEAANMGHMPKCEAAGQAADELEGLSEPDVPDELGELEVASTEMVNKDKRKGTSRAMRLSNAQSLLQDAIGVLNDTDWEQHIRVQAILATLPVGTTVGEAIKKLDDATAKAPESDVNGKSPDKLKDEAEALAQELEEAAEVSVEFPGMFG